MQSSALVATAPPEPATLARLLQQDRAQVQAALARAGLKLRDFQALNGFAAARYLLTCWTGVAVSALLWLTRPRYWSLSIQNYLRRGQPPGAGMTKRIPGFLLLSVLCVPLSWLETGNGPILRFYARKPVS